MLTVQTTPKVLLSKREAARALSMTLAEFGSAARGELDAPGIPAIQLNGRQLFRPEDLQTWAEVKIDRYPDEPEACSAGIGFRASRIGVNV